MVKSRFEFGPERIAYYEGNGWRAYYDRNWLVLLQLVIALCQEQFSIPFPWSLAAAYYTTRASIAWAPVDHDLETVRAYLSKFYRLARRHSGLDFDPAQVARLELETWIAHRDLVGQSDKGRFVQTMVDLHCALFGLTPEQARESAEYRVLANNTVDLITGKRSTDIEADWLKLKEYLGKAYVSLEQAVSTQRAASNGHARQIQTSS